MVRVNPTEYCSRRCWQYCTNSCVPPPESVRTNTFWPTRYPGWNGNWLNAAARTCWWSAALLLPALPGRNIITNGSPVPSAPWSAHAPSG
ncbi:hypothetical protein GCM10010191_59010 [Actinomadura vinacea]|uniref:Uncharacterized protein n=1 Tax=Actinomadura vinacea TaxID=115336 RepID=A0ABN3JT43_9ACTN